MDSGRRIGLGGWQSGGACFQDLQRPTVILQADATVISSLALTVAFYRHYYRYCSAAAAFAHYVVLLVVVVHIVVLISCASCEARSCVLITHIAIRAHMDGDIFNLQWGLSVCSISAMTTTATE